MRLIVISLIGLNLFLFEFFYIRVFEKFNSGD